MLNVPRNPDAVHHGPPERGRGRDRYASVAAFTCQATVLLGREAGFPVAVLAATKDVGRHAATLAAVQYGARSPRMFEAWPLPFDEGYLYGRDLDYRQLAFDARWLGSTKLPDGVALKDGCLRVALPVGASVADLGAVLRSGLVDLSLDQVARRPDRVRHRYLTRRPVVIAPRYALVDPGDIERVRVADDLYKFRPGDLSKVARALALAVDSLAVAGVLCRIRGGLDVAGASHA